MQLENNKRLKIAVIGAGAAGMAAAFILQKKHDIVLFEKEPEIGGHIRSIEIEDGKYLDIAFGVYNSRSYKNFVNFLEKLNVSTTSTPIRIKTYDNCFQEQISANFSWKAFLPTPANIKNLYIFGNFINMIRITSKLDDAALNSLTTREFFQRYKFPDDFIYYFFLPFTIIHWPMCYKNPLDIPLKGILASMQSHGFYNPISFFTLRTVKDSGMEYIKAFKNSFKGKIIYNAGIKKIKRNDKIRISLHNSEEHIFDKIVMATHADKALQLLEKPSEDEKNILSSFKYDYYPFVVHTYDTYLKKGAMSHFFVDKKDYNSPVSWHVGLSMYKKLNTEKNYFWSSNSPFDIPKSHILHENSSMRLPLFTFESLRKQPLLASLNGKLNTYYCGSYFFDGNHECSIQSAVEIGKKFGINL